MVCEYALKRAALLICEVAGGHIVGKMQESCPEKIERKTIELDYGRIDRFVGQKIGNDVIVKILGALNYQFLEKRENGALVAAPSYMIDVTRECDVVEEILRIYGYNNIALPKHMKMSVNATPSPEPEAIRNGISNFLATIGLPQKVVFTLINLAVSAFALTSLDSVARIGRMSFQELFLDDSIEDDKMGPVRKLLTNKYFSTIVTLVLAFLLAKAGYASIWPLFGSANQLLSALALLACAVFLKRTNRKGWMLWIPMGIMVCVTFTALVMTIQKLIVALTSGATGVLGIGGNVLQLVFAVLILALGVVVVVEGIKALTAKNKAAAEEANA